VEKSSPFEASDFFELDEEEVTELTPEQMLQWARNLADHFNRGKKPG
jgi:hypothetical protein